MNAVSADMPFGRIRVVLVETSHPGNIGSAARAMKNMGLRDLVLVNPKHFPHPDATALASGADDILSAAQVVDSLPAALTGCHWVVGSSARPRRSEWPLLEVRGAALKLVASAALGPCAVVFGRERTGLSNDEMDYCHALLQIPADAVYSSLNLAQAVQIVAYEVWMAGRTPPAPFARDFPPAEKQEVERFYAHLESVLRATGFLDPANPRHLMRRLRRLFDRSEMDRNEVNILRGILTSCENACQKASKSDQSNT